MEPAEGFANAAPKYVYSEGIYSMDILGAMLIELDVVPSEAAWLSTKQLLCASGFRVRSLDNWEGSQSDACSSSVASSSQSVSMKRSYSSLDQDSDVASHSASDHQFALLQSSLSPKDQEIARLMQVVEAQRTTIKEHHKVAKCLRQKCRRTSAKLGKVQEEFEVYKREKEQFAISKVGSSAASGTWLTPMGHINLAVSWNNYGDNVKRTAWFRNDFRLWWWWAYWAYWLVDLCFSLVYASIGSEKHFQHIPSRFWSHYYD